MPIVPTLPVTDELLDLMKRALLQNDEQAKQEIEARFAAAKQEETRTCVECQQIQPCHFYEVLAEPAWLCDQCATDIIG